MAERTEDMGVEKRLKVTQDQDGDVIVSIVTGRGMPIRGLEHSASVEFSLSGCHSPITRSALLGLMRAMEEDETLRPDPHRPKNAV